MKVLGDLRAFYAATSTPKTTPEGMATTRDTIMALLPGAVNDARALRGSPTEKKKGLLPAILELAEDAGFTSTHDARTGLHLAMVAKRIGDCITATMKCSQTAYGSSARGSTTPTERCAAKIIKHRVKILHCHDAAKDRLKKFCAVLKAHIASADFAARCVHDDSDIPITTSDLSGTRAEKREFLRRIAPDLVEAERAEKRAIKALIAKDDEDPMLEGSFDAAASDDNALDQDELGEDEPNAIVDDDHEVDEDEDVCSDDLSEESDEEDSSSGGGDDDDDDSGEEADGTANDAAVELGIVDADDAEDSSAKEDKLLASSNAVTLREVDAGGEVRNGRKFRKRRYLKVNLDTYKTLDDEFKVDDSAARRSSGDDDDSESEALEEHANPKKKKKPRYRNAAELVAAVARDEATEMEQDARRLATELAESIQKSVAR
jgi:hypothetical protein